MASIAFWPTWPLRCRCKTIVADSSGLSRQLEIAGRSRARVDLVFANGEVVAGGGLATVANEERIGALVEQPRCVNSTATASVALAEAVVALNEEGEATGAANGDIDSGKVLVDLQNLNRAIAENTAAGGAAGVDRAAGLYGLAERGLGDGLS